MKIQRFYVDIYSFLNPIRCQKCCKPTGLKNETLKIMYFQIKEKSIIMKQKFGKRNKPA